MTLPRAWRGRPPGLSIHLGPVLGTAPKLPSWLPEPRRVTRLRIGSSLCPRLLPTPDRLRHAMSSARRSTARLELETPPVGDRDLDRLRRLLDRLSEAWPGADVVVNDWGVLRVLQREHPDLVPVIGRVLHRQMRDPRIPAVDPQRLQGTPPGWGRGSATSPAWVRLVQSAGVHRVEVDWPLHGLDLVAWRELDLDLTLHLPLVLVASGRSCVLRDPHGARDRADGGERCDLSCTHTAIHLEAPWEVGPDDPPRPDMIRLGNAELARLPATVLEQALAWVDAGGSGPDRIVVFPEGP